MAECLQPYGTNDIGKECWETFLQVNVPVRSLDEGRVDLRHAKGKPCNGRRFSIILAFYWYFCNSLLRHTLCYLAGWPLAWPPGRPGSHWLSCHLLWDWGLCMPGQPRPGLPWSPLGNIALICLLHFWNYISPQMTHTFICISRIFFFYFFKLSRRVDPAVQMSFCFHQEQQIVAGNYKSDTCTGRLQPRMVHVCPGT